MHAARCHDAGRRIASKRENTHAPRTCAPTPAFRHATLFCIGCRVCIVLIRYAERENSKNRVPRTRTQKSQVTNKSLHKSHKVTVTKNSVTTPRKLTKLVQKERRECGRALKPARAAHTSSQFNHDCGWDVSRRYPDYTKRVHVVLSREGGRASLGLVLTKRP
jgi:hypothetical protein